MNEKNGCSFIGMWAIIYRNKIAQILLFTGIYLLGNYSYAQKITLSKNEYGLQVVKDEKIYKQIIKMDSSHRMIPLNLLLQTAIINFYYATKNNFTKQILYKNPHAYLRLEAASALRKVQDSLHKIGLDIKIFDAYRPYSVTKKMWEIVPDERYAANPAKGSGHNRGVAVDLTLVNMKTGKELAMPTQFDNFSDTAHHDFMQLSEEKIHNRSLLKRVMERYGFIALSTEWWHYSLPNPKRYELLDLSFEQMEKIGNTLY